MFSVTRAVAVAATTLAAAALPLLAAAPAQADTRDCAGYLASEDYDIDRYIIATCGAVANFSGETEQCVDRLLQHNVRPWHAIEACERASW